LPVAFRAAILTAVLLLGACDDEKPRSICDVDYLPLDQAYEFSRVAIYSDGHTSLAFDYSDPQCEPVAFELPSARDIWPIWDMTSQSTQNSTIGAVGNITAKIEKSHSRANRLRIIKVGKWEAHNIDAQLQALNARMPKPKAPP